MAFQNPVRTLVIPVGHDPNTGPVIVLDGTTGKITIIGTGGQRIVINPDPTNPQIEFYSDDETQFAFINQPATNPSLADLGMNSGQYTAPDATVRTIRNFLSSSSGRGRFEVVKSSTQENMGGFVQVGYNFGSLGYWNVPGGGSASLLEFQSTGDALFTIQRNLFQSAATDVHLSAQNGQMLVDAETSMSFDSNGSFLVDAVGLVQLLTTTDMVFKANGAGADIEFQRDNVAKMRIESGRIASIEDHVFEASAKDVNNMSLLKGNKGVTNTGPAAGTSFVTHVNFPVAFPVGTTPHATANINSGAGSTSGWHVRCINVSNTGMDLFGFGASSTWTVGVSWTAIVEAS